MKTTYRLAIIFSLLAALLSNGVAGAQDDFPPGTETIDSLNLPASAQASATFTATAEITPSWDCNSTVGDFQACFHVYIADDMWSGGTANYTAESALEGVTVVATHIGDGPTLGGRDTEQLNFELDVDSFYEIVNFNIYVDPDAPAGLSYPIWIRERTGVGSNLFDSRLGYLDVTAAPTTRYIGASDCNGQSPCTTGTYALTDAIQALPSAGGLIYIVGLADNLAGGQFDVGNITLRGYGDDAELRGADSTACLVSLLTLMGNANLTIENLALNGIDSDPGYYCRTGVNVVGTGTLTIDNGGRPIQNFDYAVWLDSPTTAVINNTVFSANGAENGFDILIESGADLLVSNSTFMNNDPTGASTRLASIEVDQGSVEVVDSAFENLTVNAIWLHDVAASLTLTGNTFDTMFDDAIRIESGSAVIDNNTFTAMENYGVYLLGGSATLRGNTFINGSNYAYIRDAGTLVAYANNLIGNGDGSFQAYVSDLNDAAKNYWGSTTDANVGPTTDGTTSYAAGWNARLGADVVTWADGVGSVSLGSAALSGGGANTGVIMNLGRGTENAPFANGVPPYANRLCSDFYDFYGIGGTWTVQLPVDTSTACVNNVRNYEIAYMIGDNTQCATANDPACWDRIPEAQMTVSGNNFIITGLSLAGTHIVAGDENGADPTVISLNSITATPGVNWLPAALVAAMALGGVILVLRKRR